MELEEGSILFGKVRNCPLKSLADCAPQGVTPGFDLFDIFYGHGAER
jgi:hypothetical protein